MIVLIRTFINPYSTQTTDQNRHMQSKEVLAANVQAILDRFGQNENAFSVEYKVPKSNLRKMRLGITSVGTDTIDELATALRIRACDLLDPDLAQRVRSGEPLRMSQAKPPVIPEGDWKKLSPRTRALVEDICARALSDQLPDASIAWLHDGVQRLSNKE